MSTEQKQPSVFAAISAAMKDVGAVGKNGENTAQKYKYRGIADVYKACQPAMARHGLVIVPTEILDDATKDVATKYGGTMLHIRQRVLFYIYGPSGDFLPMVVTGEAMDSGDKASNKRMSAAIKYVLTQLFVIPEEDSTLDTESASPERVAPAPKPNTK